MEQRGKGKRWYALVDLKRGVDGKRQQRMIRLVGNTKREADKDLTRILHEIDNGTYVDKRTKALNDRKAEEARLAEEARIADAKAKAATVGQYLDQWLRVYAEPKVGGKTLQRYRGIVDCHLKPAFGDLPLTDLKPQRIAETYAAWRLNGNQGKGERNGRGLSAKSIVHMHRVLREALQSAVVNELVPRNVADAVERPKVAQKEMRVLTEAQVARLLQAAQGSRLHAPIYAAVTTLVRRGELLALRWSDVDFEKGALSVSRSLEELKGELTFKEPKTAQSRRVMSLDPDTLEVLRKHRVEQLEVRMRFGDQYAKEEDLVFPGPHLGKPWRPSTLTHAFQKLVVESGVPRVRFHDLRHTGASLMLDQGASVETVRQRLGHTSAKTTLDMYVHGYPDSQKEGATKLGASIAGAIDKLERATG